MFKRLEEKKDPLKMVDSTGAAECSCPCKSPVDKSKEENPAANQAAVNLAVYYEINGKIPD